MCCIIETIYKDLEWPGKTQIVKKEKIVNMVHFNLPSTHQSHKYVQKC